MLYRNAHIAFFFHIRKNVFKKNRAINFTDRRFFLVFLFSACSLTLINAQTTVLEEAKLTERQLAEIIVAKHYSDSIMTDYQKEKLIIKKEQIISLGRANIKYDFTKQGEIEQINQLNVNALDVDNNFSFSNDSLLISDGLDENDSLLLPAGFDKPLLDTNIL